MATTGEKPGKGKYQCTKCPEIIVLDDKTRHVTTVPKM